MTLTQITKAGLDELALDHVFTIGASGSSAYTFQGEGLNGTVNNPTLYLTRGKTYRFENGSGGHPIRIQSTSGASGTAYNTGVTNNAGSGTVIVEVQHDAPDVLYYQCTSHAAMNGILYITGALADGGVTTSKLANDAVNADKLASDAVVTASIVDDAVTADKLANSINSAIAANTAKDLTALSASNLTSGTVPDARISASSVTQHATSFDDNNIVNDISSLALKVNALQNATRYNTNSTYVDTFQDEAGIASKTNMSRNSGGEYMSSISSKSFYKPNQAKFTFTMSSTGVATNGEMTFAAWMKSANGSNWTYNGSQGGGIMNLQTAADTSKWVCFNIGYGQNNGKFGAHTPGVSDCNTAQAWSAPTNKWVLGVVRTGYNWSSGHVEIMHRAYDAGNFTTDSDANGGTNNYGTNAGGLGQLFKHNSNGYTGDYDNTHIAMMGFWNESLNGTQLQALFNNGQPFDWSQNNGNYTESSKLQEYFKMDEGSGTTLINSANGGNASLASGSGTWDSDVSQLGSASATGNFVSNAITAPSSTNKMGVVITFIDGYGSTTINTDLKVYLSADNGSNFTQATLVLAPNFATGVRMAVANDVSVTAGTQLKYKVEVANQSANSKEVRVSGISLQY